MPCGYETVYFGDEACSALLDSGSTLSFIDASLKNDLIKLGNKFTSQPISAKVANQQWILCPGYVTAKFKIKQRHFSYPLVLMENCLHPVILGVDFLSFSGLLPNFKLDTWHWADKPMVIYSLRRIAEILSTCAALGLLDEFSASVEEITKKVEAISTLTPEQKDELLQVLLMYRYVFSSRVGKLNAIMDIDTGNAPPIAIKPYHLSRFKELQIEEHIDKMLELGIVKEGWSPWSAPTFLVPKKGGLTRMVIAYCELNKVTRFDNYPTPNILDMVSRSLKPKFKSSLDLRDAYWCLNLAESAQIKASFVSSRRQIIPLRCMFGLKTAPARFCRALTEVLEPVKHLNVRNYFDDCSLLDEEWKDHIYALARSLDILGTSGVRLNLSKTKFCEKELLLLGYLITDAGISPNPEKFKLLQDWPTPKTIKQIRKWLGLAGWLRKFVYRFSVKAAPLYEVLKGTKPTFFWGAAQDKAFNQIKADLLSAPILAPPDLDKPFHLFTDASGSGIGGILAQYDENNKLKTLDMFSRRLSNAERNYVTCEREFLAIIHSIRHWRHLLEGSTTLIHCDNQALVVLRKVKNVSGRIAKWLVDLSMLDAKLVFNPGKLNAAADALSRLYEEENREANLNPVLIPLDEGSTENQRFLFNNNCFIASVDLEQITLPNIALELAKDEFCSALLKALKGEKLSGLPPSVIRFVKYYLPKSILDQEQQLIYVNVAKDIIHKTDYKILIPKSLQEKIISLNHSLPSSGHPGMRATLKRIFRLYTWRRASVMVSQFVSKCGLCAQHKAKTTRIWGKVSAAPLEYPFRRLNIDCVGPFPRSSKGNKFLLTVLDTFSGWLECFPLRSANTKTIVTVLVNEIFSRFGTASIIQSDNGAPFIDKITREIYRQFRVKPAYSTLFKPSSNPVERSHRDLKNRIAMFINKSHREWDVLVKQFCLAHNSSPNKSSGYSPAMLFLGKELNLPADPPFETVHDVKLPV